MKITKLGHCCLLIEEGGLRILTDPGAYSSAQNEIQGIDVVLITHEHPDHLHLESVKKIIVNNPKLAAIITNTAVSQILRKDSIVSEIVEAGETKSVNGVVIEGVGNDHAVIYRTLPPVQNTGYMIANRFFYPGDALTIIDRPVEILALPVAGPWLKLAEAIDYAKKIKPRLSFPVHDGMLKYFTPVHQLPKKILESAGINFEIFEEHEDYQL